MSNDGVEGVEGVMGLVGMLGCNGKAWVRLISYSSGTVSETVFDPSFSWSRGAESTREGRSVDSSCLMSNEGVMSVAGRLGRSDDTSICGGTQLYLHFICVLIVSGVRSAV